MDATLLYKALDWLLSVFGGLRRVRLLVHQATLLPTGEECFFLNITNLSGSRDIEVTHVWFDTMPQVHVLNPARPLPRRLRPDESWETWVPVGYLPTSDWNRIFKLGRARLSSGRVLKSRENRAVPPGGIIPGAV